MANKEHLQNLLEMYDSSVVQSVLDTYASGYAGSNGTATNGTATNGAANSDTATNGTQSGGASVAERFAPAYGDKGEVAESLRVSIAESGAWLKKSLDEVADPGEPLAQGEGGRVDMAQMPAIERIIADSNFLPAHFLEEGADIQRAVGRVTLKEAHAGLPAGNGWGTGFLVAPNILMTNNHVIPTEAFAKKVEVQFNYQLSEEGMPQTVDTYQFSIHSLFYTNSALDFTLIYVRPKYRFTLRRNTDLTDLDLSPITGSPLIPTQPPIVVPPYLWRSAGSQWGYLQLPLHTAYSVDQRINIVQHPRGRRKEVALHDNKITDIYANHLRYTTDTEPGSSGSPVFNNTWDLLAIHHAGGEQQNGVWINNQGVRMDKIVDNIRSNVSASVQAQLGLS